jgi:glycosyltransferase involved in cell wall biosynthesis
MSGLIKSQVIPVLASVSRNSPDLRLTVIAVWQPWVYFSQRRLVETMRKELEKAGIGLRNRPLAILPSRFFLYDSRTLPILMVFVRLAFRLLGLGRFDLVHARSYMAGYAAAALRSRCGYKLIFDMRSLMPEEYVTVGKWSLGSPTYRKWKEYERFTVENSDSHVAVSAPMKADADRICPSREAQLIYLNADVERLGFDEKARAALRSECRWDDCFVLAYLGSMGFEGEWNNIRNYAEYLRLMEPILGAWRMVFVVPRILPGFREALQGAGIPDDRVRFVQGTGNLRSWLSAADAGMQVMSPGPDSHTRFGVKVVEYLACGLPVIANSNAGAAADFIEANEAGIRLDPGSAFEETLARMLRTSYPRERLMSLARDTFSQAVIGRKYRDLYDRLLGIVERPR